MTDKIAEFTSELGSGLFPSEPGRKPIFWQDGRNVTFESDHLQSAFGQFAMFISGQNEPVTGVKGSVVDGVPTVFFSTLTSQYKWDLANGVQDITPIDGMSAKVPYTGTRNDPWQFSRWGNWMVSSNGVAPIQVYKNADKFLDLAGQPFDWAKLIYATDTHLLALNTSNGGNYIEWTDLDNIEQWQTSSINDAGNKPLRNLDSDILAAKKLRDTLIAYTNNEMIAVNYLARPFVFGTEFLLEGFGPFGPNAVAAVGGKHFGMGHRGIWVTDGVSFEFIQNPAVMDFIYRDADTRVDLELGNHVIGWHDQLQTQVVFYYPKESGAGYNDIGVGFNYKTGKWTVYDYGRTAVDDAGVFPYAITGGNGGNVFQQSVSDAPPQAGDAGRVNLDTTAYAVSLGLGEGGLGECGLGGYDGGAG